MTCYSCRPSIRQPSRVATRIAKDNFKLMRQRNNWRQAANLLAPRTCRLRGATPAPGSEKGAFSDKYSNCYSKFRMSRVAREPMTLFEAPIVFVSRRLPRFKQSAIIKKNY
jgi:hypothetical protein